MKGLEPFSESSWDQSPRKLGRLFDHQIINEDDIAYALNPKAILETGEKLSIRIFDDKAMLFGHDLTRLADLYKYLPSNGFTNLSELEKHFCDNLGMPRFGLVMNYVDGLFPDETRNEVFRLSFEIAEKIGIPAHYLDVALFCGNYGSTPFGVHTDFAHVFAYMVFGERRIRVWHPDVFKNKKEASKEHKNRRAHSTELDMTPGEMSFWPSPWWHVGESQGLSASVNFGFFYRSNEALVNKLSAANILKNIQRSDPNMIDVEESACREYAKYVSNLGLPLYPSRPNESDRVLKDRCRLEFLFPRTWKIVRSKNRNTIWLYVRGHELDVPSDIHIDRFLELLKGQTKWVASTLLTKFDSTLNQKSFSKFIRSLHSVRGVRIEH